MPREYQLCRHRYAYDISYILWFRMYAYSSLLNPQLLWTHYQNCIRKWRFSNGKKIEVESMVGLNFLDLNGIRNQKRLALCKCTAITASISLFESFIGAIFFSCGNVSQVRLLPLNTFKSWIRLWMAYRSSLYYSAAFYHNRYGFCCTMEWHLQH